MVGVVDVDLLAQQPSSRNGCNADVIRRDQGAIGILQTTIYSACSARTGNTFRAIGRMKTHVLTCALFWVAVGLPHPVFLGYGDHDGFHGEHLEYGGHGVAMAGPLLGPTSVTGPHVGAAALAGPATGPSHLSGSVTGPVRVSGVVRRSAIVTRSVAGPAHVEGYDGPYDGGYYAGPGAFGDGYGGHYGGQGYGYGGEVTGSHSNSAVIAGPSGRISTQGAGLSGPYGGSDADAGSHTNSAVIAGPSGRITTHGTVLAGPASHGAGLSRPYGDSAAVQGPHSSSTVVAGPSGKITTHTDDFGTAYANRGYRHY